MGTPPLTPPVIPPPKWRHERDYVERVAGTGSNSHRILEETLALGFLVLDKWNRAATAHGANPTVQQVADRDRFTDRHFKQFKAVASRSLVEFAASLPRVGAEPSWWYGVGQGVVVAAFVYSLGLAVLALIAFLLHGGDFMDLIRRFGG